ncbi:phage tail assembly chaperone [Pseudomonas saxonica]|uniref:Phage tail assembly chaperone-like domain-containing protein n=1 Tax=Pseudomonas saxonica TaxID=2600598 RepID=A0A5C5PSX5_9PSED|nr:phage tail assembly chaperone [Pseudomonas saxonica]TWR83891.1 hypothetical protein FJD37_20415 [Pseudomonas saxonica]
MPSELVIYHVDGRTNEYIGAGLAAPDPVVEKNWLIPAHAYTEKPPEVEEGYALIRQGDTWRTIKDYRGTVYRTTDGSPELFTELGPLPDDLTETPRPDENHIWTQGQWLLDEQAKVLNEQASARAWRDAQIASVQWLRDRYRDESELELDHTLTPEQYKQLLGYLQSLRDWPQSPDFPTLALRPIQPDWIAEQTR